MSFCVFISSYITNFYAFVLVYGIGFGFFGGVTYVGTLYIGFQHFPAHKGKVSGILLCGNPHFPRFSSELHPATHYSYLRI